MKNESLEELKAIIDNAPEGANQVEIHSSGNVNCYINYNEDGSFVWHEREWINATSKTLGHCWFIRSLSDIERIIELMEDEKRLDHLQKCNQIFNGRAGSNYGWRVDWNHNRIAILDTGLKGVTIRNAIDEHIKKMGDL